MNDRKKWLYLLIGLVLGAGGVYLILCFPGGRGPEEKVGRVDISYSEGQTYRVLRVIDGDTIVIEPGVHVRYAGISAPEIMKFVEHVEPYAREATRANEELLHGRSVRLRFGPEKLGRYGRLLACVEVLDPDTGQWLDVGEELVKKGLAKRYLFADQPPNERRLFRAEREAHKAGLGLWSLEPEQKDESE